MTPRHRPRITLADVRLPLLLVGLPGAGKTTVARLLAAALGVQATDTDAEIRRRARMTIPQIFAREGEESFRDRETRALRAVLGAQAGAQGVVALGGGAVLREENRALLAGRTVIHLSASPSTAAAHVGDGAGRPVVNPAADSDAVRAGAGPGAAGADAVLARLEALHAQRGPLYAQVSTLTVPTDGLTPEQVAALVLVALGAQAPDTARALSAVAPRSTAARAPPRSPPSGPAPFRPGRGPVPPLGPGPARIRRPRGAGGPSPCRRVGPSSPTRRASCAWGSPAPGPTTSSSATTCPTRSCAASSAPPAAGPGEWPSSTPTPWRTGPGPCAPP